MKLSNFVVLFSTSPARTCNNNGRGNKTITSCGAKELRAYKRTRQGSEYNEHRQRITTLYNMRSPQSCNTVKGGIRRGLNTRLISSKQE